MSKNTSDVFVLYAALFMGTAFAVSGIKNGNSISAAVGALLIVAGLYFYAQSRRS